MEVIKRDHHIANTPPRLVYDVVTDYENYPSFFKEFKEAVVLDKEDSAVVVEFTCDYGMKVSYTLRIEHDEAQLKTSWTYVGGALKNSEGGWHFLDDGKGGTDIRYQVAAEVSIMVPKMISNRLISHSIPKMFDQLEEELARRA